MSLTLWYHPYSGYGQKAATAAYELGLDFTIRVVDHADEAGMVQFQSISPFGKMPVLVEPDGTTTCESSIVIERLDQLAGGGRLIPADSHAALETRLVDRIIDTYGGGPMNRIVLEKFRPDDSRDPFGSAADAVVLAQCWDWLEHRLSDGRTWGAGDSFSLADCNASILTYARRLVPFGDRPRLRAWHRRLMERPSFQQALADAAPYGDLMPAPSAED